MPSSCSVASQFALLYFTAPPPHCPHLVLPCNNKLSICLLFALHTKCILLQSFLLCAWNILVVGSITLGDWFLLPQDAGHCHMVKHVALLRAALLRLGPHYLQRGNTKPRHKPTSTPASCSAYGKTVFWWMNCTLAHSGVMERTYPGHITHRTLRRACFSSVRRSGRYVWNKIKKGIN